MRSANARYEDKFFHGSLVDKKSPVRSGPFLNLECLLGRHFFSGWSFSSRRFGSRCLFWSCLGNWSCGSGCSFFGGSCFSGLRLILCVNGILLRLCSGSSFSIDGALLCYSG